MPPIRIVYKNHKGVTAEREIIPQRFYFGSTEYHKKPQWLLTALDVAKNEDRTFAMQDVVVWGLDEKPEKDKEFRLTGFIDGRPAANMDLTPEQAGSLALAAEHLINHLEAKFITVPPTPRVSLRLPVKRMKEIVETIHRVIGDGIDYDLGDEDVLQSLRQDLEKLIEA